MNKKLPTLFVVMLCLISAFSTAGPIRDNDHDTEQEMSVSKNIIFKDYEKDDIDGEKNTLNSDWTPTEVISTESIDRSYSPDFATDFIGGIHVSWDDRTNYNGFFFLYI